MKNFKAGDKVVRTGMTRRGIQCGKEYEVRSIESQGDLYLKGHSFRCHESQFVLVHSYPNPPHKHSALIIAWAQGAVIEHFRINTGLWKVLLNPAWDTVGDYRIKPNKSDKDIKIEELEEKLLSIHKELGTLKGEG